MTYLEKFTQYAPELRQAIDMMDSEFKRELDSTEVTTSAFVVCDAFSEFWSAWHDGQNSHLYSIGSRFADEFDYHHRGSELNEPGSQVREFYACLCAVFQLDDSIRWEYFNETPPPSGSMPNRDFGTNED